MRQRLRAALERRIPERRLFIRSEDHTRFIRLRPATQLVMWTGGACFVGWSVVATAIVLMDSIGAGNYRVQAERDKMIYEQRLNALSGERDLRAAEAAAAQERFAAALAQVSAMQSELLALDEDRRELERGLAAVHASLGRIMDERDAARAELAALRAPGSAAEEAARLAEIEGTLGLVADTLTATAAERDRIAQDAETAVGLAAELDLELRLMEERNDEIFAELEDALAISVEPLHTMFREVGLDPAELIEEVRRGYSGIGGPITPLAISTMGSAADDGTLRANRILDRLDRLNLYRIAVERVPFAIPVRDPFRFTSGFGPRWGRMHEGVDLAGPIGTPIYATAYGVVVEAGWSSGYGRMVRIRHDFGLETLYAHLNSIAVVVGQRVSRGEHIGDMGNSGRSTGPHLHYEIRTGGEAIDPMIYIGAGNDVL